MKKIYWRVSIKHPLKDDILEINNFNSIEEISKQYPKFNNNTWRNICLGRSKCYNKFLSVEKLIKDENSCSYPAPLTTDKITKKNLEVDVDV